MSNYQRLISYIYAYEGGIKGKNIGFAKLETRGSQCRVTVNVKRIFVGGNPIGIYLLAGQDEIKIGTLFARNGAGEFRTLVSAQNVEGSGYSLEDCYGLTVHDTESTWRSYTTIWEDAVAQAAEIELANVTSENVLKRERKEQQDDQEEALPISKEIEEALDLEDLKVVNTEIPPRTPQNRVVGVPIPNRSPETVNNVSNSGLPTSSGMVGTPIPVSEPDTSTIPVSEPEMEQNMEPISEPDSSGSVPRQLEPIMGAGDTATIEPHMGRGEANVSPDPSAEVQSEMNQEPELQPESELEPEPNEAIQDQVQAEQPESNQEPAVGTSPDVGLGSVRDSIMSPDATSVRGMQVNANGRMRSVSMPNQGSRANARNTFHPTASTRAMGPGMLRSQTLSTESLKPGPAIRNAPKTGAEAHSEMYDKMKAATESCSEQEMWEMLRKRYPKLQVFDYADGCEILCIKPQDIGLLPREAWVYGNNSFLLHGYYNFRYLILAKLNNPAGKSRYILGVPGHYLSNEKYMANMFGFPDFVLCKKQPPRDGRFGYWYTDIKIGD